MPSLLLHLAVPEVYHQRGCVNLGGGGGVERNLTWAHPPPTIPHTTFPVISTAISGDRGGVIPRTTKITTDPTISLAGVAGRMVDATNTTTPVRATISQGIAVREGG